MTHNTRLITYIASMVIASTPVLAGDNPIFGKAHVTINTPTVNKHIRGKGYYADLYGYYGSFYSNLAAGYGMIGQEYKDASSYYTAFSYSRAATQDFYNAYYFQVRGQ